MNDMIPPRKSVSMEEQETNITLCPLDEDATVYSCVPAVVKRIYKYAAEYPDKCRIDHDDGYGVICYVPPDWISFKPRKKRQMTEEQRAASAARLAAMREAKRK